MKIFKLFSIAALTLMMAACSSEMSNDAQEGKKVPFSATIGAPNSDATTRTAYTESGIDINVAWKVGDKLALIHNGKKDIAKVEKINLDGSATITGVVTGATDGENVDVCYPAYSWEWNATASGAIKNAYYISKTLAQDGTLKYIQDSLDVRKAESTLSVNGNYATLANNVTLASHIVIWKFALQDDAETPAALSATKLTMKVDDETPVTLASTKTLTTATSTIYMAMDKIVDEKLILEATVGKDTFIYTKAGVTTVLGKYYQSTASMESTDPHLIPLTFEALGNGNITFKNEATGSVTYRINGGTAQTIASGETKEIPVLVGQKVRFYGDNASYTPDVNSRSKISSDVDFYAYGNIMSLIDRNNFATVTTLTEDNTFMYLFSGNKHLKNSPNVSLVLPAMTLTKNCYAWMFSSCDALTTAPELPATSLAECCYQYMFYDCQGLTTAPATLPALSLKANCYECMFQSCPKLTASPELPARSLAKDCYKAMFTKCVSLTSVPATLPATELSSGCYASMFVSCTALTTAPALPATILSGRCYAYMFSGCSALTTAPALPSTMLVDYCYSGMFSGCSALTAAPALPATKMKKHCYSYMFSDCNSLTTAPALPATELADSCYYYMFSGIQSLTTAPALPATTLAKGCYNSMFLKCPNLANAPEILPATTLADYCYYSMFYGCRGLTTAPILPAPTLTKGCYNYMFFDCNALSEITCLATDISAEKCTMYWVGGVANTGTFKYDNAAITSWEAKTGYDGIPTGWTAVPAN